MSPSGFIQQPPRDLALPPDFTLHPTVILPSLRPPLKPPNIDETVTSSNPEPDLNIGIEENSPPNRES